MNEKIVKEKIWLIIKNKKFVLKVDIEKNLDHSSQEIEFI
jgi:hypothetical protein